MANYCIAFDVEVEESDIIEVVKLGKKDIFQNAHGMIYSKCIPEGTEITTSFQSEGCACFIMNHSVRLSVNQRYFETLGIVPYRIRGVVEYKRE